MKLKYLLVEGKVETYITNSLKLLIPHIKRTAMILESKHLISEFGIKLSTNSIVINFNLINSKVNNPKLKFFNAIKDNNDGKLILKLDEINSPNGKVDTLVTNSPIYPYTHIFTPTKSETLFDGIDQFVEKHIKFLK